MTCNYLPGKSFITLTTGQSIDDGFSNWPAGKYIMKDFKWQSDKATKQQSDKATKRQSDKVTKWQSDKVTKRQSDKVTFKGWLLILICSVLHFDGKQDNFDFF